MTASEIELGSRARRGNLILRRLKKNPHEVAGLLAYPADFDGKLEIITDRPQIVEVSVAAHHVSVAQSNGMFVVDTDSQGTPVWLRQQLSAVAAAEQPAK